jgi:hypothetical protein
VRRSRPARECGRLRARQLGKGVRVVERPDRGLTVELGPLLSRREREREREEAEMDLEAITMSRRERERERERGGNEGLELGCWRLSRRESSGRNGKWEM